MLSVCLLKREVILEVSKSSCILITKTNVFSMKYHSELASIDFFPRKKLNKYLSTKGCNTSGFCWGFSQLRDLSLGVNLKQYWEKIVLMMYKSD